MKQNTFKTQPVIPESRINDFKPKKLNPPQFEEDRRQFWNKNIAYSQTMIKCSSKQF